MTHYMHILRPALLALALCGSAAQAALVPPPGYYEGIEKLKPGDSKLRCQTARKIGRASRRARA